MDYCFTDCKTVRIFAYSSTREQSNKRSGTRLKTESEVETLKIRCFFSGLTRPKGVWGSRASRASLLRHALPIFLLILRKKPTVLQSNCFNSSWNVKHCAHTVITKELLPCQRSKGMSAANEWDSETKQERAKYEWRRGWVIWEITAYETSSPFSLIDNKL